MPLPARPVLKPALRRVWRDSATLQLGLDPARAILLAGLDAADSRLLTLLDGSRDVATVFAEADRAGCGPERAVRVIELLAAADALDDAPPDDPRLAPDLLSLSLLHRGAGAAARVLHRRRAASVVVHGAGRVGASLAGLLVAAGLGAVTVVDDAPVRPADLAPGGIRSHSASHRGTAATQPFRGRSPRQRVTTGRTPTAHVDLAVVAPAGSTAPPEVLAAVRRQPHLLVTIRETTAYVGPLVRPGVSACLRCLHLARADRDPAWSELAAQLAGSGRDVEACDVTLATFAAAIAAMQVLNEIDGTAQQASTLGGVLEFDLADGRLRRRSVRSHPSCGCGAASVEATMDA
ncbi:MAG TPA: TOMM precursor leader peptide-binding protein [Mycobacteriales bacterium]|nr:TOMM precursor leader peptide-binding protein [Mycobacteriales bacterium]